MPGEVHRADCPACAAAVRMGLNPALCDVALAQHRERNDPYKLLREAALSIPETTYNADLLRRIEAALAKEKK